MPVAEKEGLGQESQAARLGFLGAPILVALVSSSLLFWIAGLESGYLTVDSGPYLSIAHNLSEHGRPVSNFGFLGSFQQLPAVPGFIAPGLGLWIGLLQPLAGDAIGAGKIVLWGSLLIIQLGAIYLLADRTGATAFASGASVLLIWNAWTGRFAGVILTELPFIACLVTATWAASRVLAGRASRPILYGVLPLASAMLCLTRYLGVFLPAVFSAVFLARAVGQRGSWPRVVGYLAYYNLLAVGPVMIWLAVAWRSGPSIFPRRPPSQLEVGPALWEAAVNIGGWVGPWWVVAAVLAGVLRLTSAVPERRQPFSWPELFLGLALAGYVGFLIAARTRGALYPIGQLGERYMLPAWPFAFFLTAILIHRLVWSRRRVAVNAVVVLGAVVAVGFGLKLLAPYRPPPVFPTETETYAAALELLPPDTRDVVLCNYGQPLTYDRPEARIIGIPSREDFSYSMDLGELARRHRIDWIVLFDHPAKERLYGPWFSSWLAGPPPAVAVTGGRRLRDGVIYRLGE